jgi:hypothetical protein
VGLQKITNLKLDLAGRKEKEGQICLDPALTWNQDGCTGYRRSDIKNAATGLKNRFPYLNFTLKLGGCE